MAVPTFNIPSQTETSLNNIVSGGFQSEKPKKTQTDFYQKVDKFVASGKFATEEEAFVNAAKAAVHFGDSFEGVDLQSIITPKQDEVVTEDKQGFDLGLDAAEGLQNLGGALKIESKFDLSNNDTSTLLGSFKNSGENLLNSFRFAANLPGDTIELAGDIVGMVSNVVGTATSVKDISVGVADKLGLVDGTEEQKMMVDAIGDELVKNFGTAEAALETITQNPMDTITSIFGGAGLAKGGIKTTKFGKTAKGQELISKLEKIQEATNPMNVVKGELALGKTVVTKPIAATGDLLGKGFIKSTGVDLETVKTIVKNPKLFEQAEKGVITRQSTADDVVKAIDKKAADISDIGAEYKGIREIQSNITPDDINILKSNIDNTLAKNDIRVIDGKLNFDNSQIGQSGNRKAIQDAYDLVHNRTKFDKGGDFLNLRQSIDDTINFKSEATTRGEKIVRDIRGEIDNVAKTKLGGLKELDAKFAPERQEFNRVNKLIRNKDGSLKDNYVSTIANITGKGKELKLERIKKLIPNIEDQVNALKAVEDVVLAGGNKVGAYAAGTILGGGALGVGTGGLSVLGALATYMITRPQTLVNVLKAYNTTSAIKKSITGKIKSGIKLTKEEAKVVGAAIKEQALEKGGQFADDIADKVGARSKFIDDSGKDFSKVGVAKSADQVSFGTKDLPYGLTRSEVDEISKYTNWGYKGSSDAKKLDSILEKLPNYDGFVFRKDNKNIKDFVTGEDFSFGKPLSATNKVDILDNFKGNTEFTIKSSLGKDISNFSDIPAEGEILFNSNAKFKIGSIIKSSDGVNMIELKQIK